MEDFNKLNFSLIFFTSCKTIACNPVFEKVREEQKNGTKPFQRSLKPTWDLSEALLLLRYMWTQYSFYKLKCFIWNQWTFKLNDFVLFYSKINLDLKQPNVGIPKNIKSSLTLHLVLVGWQPTINLAKSEIVL